MSDKSEMVERVGRAIYESRRHNKPWGILGQHQGIYLKAARAAIEAMMSGRSTQTEFEVHQDGGPVASSTSLADAMHYAMVYGQDGPVELFEVFRLPLSPSLKEQERT